MNVPRSTLIYVAIWVGVVMVCSTLVWAVISRAGEGVTSEETPGRSPSTSGPRGSGTPDTAPTVSPSPSPSTSSGTTPASPTSPVDPSTSSAVERTWSGVGGVVVVVCRGAAAELGTARPDTGFAIEVNDTGPDRVEVEFEGSGDSDTETRVRATCVDGEPLFEIDD